MAIDISIVGDASEAIRAAERTGSALSDVVDELEDLDRAGKDAGDGLEKGLKDAGGSADKFEDKVKSAFKEAERQATDSGKKIGSSADDGFNRAAAATDEFKNEARQNIGETFSSFRGEVEDIPQLIQDVFGGVAPAMGGAGLLLSAGIAAGIGIAVGKAQELAEKNTEVKQGVADLAQSYIDLGGDLERLDIGQIIQDWGLTVNEDNWLTFWVDEAETNFEKYARMAEEAGVSSAEAMRGMKGSYEDAQRFMEVTARKQEELNEAIEAGTQVTADGVEYKDASALAAQRERDALETLRDEVKNNLQAHEEAAEIERIYAETVKGTREEVELKNEALNESADLLSDGITSELEYKETLAETNKAIKENGENLDTNTAKGRDNWEQLLSQAEASRSFRDAQMEAGVPVDTLNVLMGEQRAAFIRSAEAAGMETAEAKALADQLGLVPTNITTDFSERGADTVKGQADAIIAKDGTPVSFPFIADTSQVDTAIRNIRNTVVRVRTTFDDVLGSWL